MMSSPGYSRQTEAPESATAYPGLRPTLWGQAHLHQRFPRLEGKISADVAVVGGGIGGLCVAYGLACRGVNVAVLEKNVIGSGQTGKTTAHLMAWNDDYYSVVEKDWGATEAAMVGESHRQAIDWVERVCEEESISCTFTRLPGYLVPHDDSPATRRTVEMELEAARRAGFEDAKILENKDGADDSLGAGFPYGLCFPSSADFHPLKFLGGLADAIVRKGGRIFERTPIFNHKGHTVSTKDGSGTVEASGAVVLATNSPMNHNLLVHARQKAERSYVVCLKLEKGSVSKANWWSTYQPYHYVRIQEEEDYDMLVVGGEDHPVGMRPHLYYAAHERLERWARARWPQAGEVLTRWSGMVYKPIDMLGLYGRNPADSSHTYIVTGDSGQGMTGSAIAGILLPALICGEYHPWTILYSPSRRPPASMDSLLGTLSVTKHTMQGYSGFIPCVDADLLNIEDLKPGCGAVVQMGLSKAAVFKEPSGELHKRSALCPHMKCTVSWNPNDGTFDCPCHGSQFSRYGVCINGPAKADLFPLDGDESKAG